MSPTRFKSKLEIQSFDEAKRHLKVIKSQSPVISIGDVAKGMANDNKVNQSKIVGQCYKRMTDDNNNTTGVNNESSVAAVLLSLHGSNKQPPSQEHNNDAIPSSLSNDSKYKMIQPKDDHTAGRYQSNTQLHNETLRLPSVSSEEDPSETGSYSNALSPSDDEKPTQSYISLIANAILSTTEKRLVLSDIYAYVLQKYSYFRNKGPGWRNSIRHNLSLNECFVKAGRSPNGKGHFWAINPANFDDFSKGDFRRRRAQRRARKAMLLQYHHPLAHNDLQGSNISTTLPSPPLSYRPMPIVDRSWYQDYARSIRYPLPMSYLSQPLCNSSDTSLSPVGRSHSERIINDNVLLPNLRKKKSFDMESLLKKDNEASVVQHTKSEGPLSRYYSDTDNNRYTRTPSIYPLNVSHHSASRFTPYCNTSCCRTRDTALIRDESDIYNLKMKAPIFKTAVPRSISINPSAESLAQAAAIARFERFGLPIVPSSLPVSYCRQLRR